MDFHEMGMIIKVLKLWQVINCHLSILLC